MDDLAAAAAAVLAAAADALAAVGISPARRYVSVRGGDWLPSACDDCDQLVVRPADIAPMIPVGSIIPEPQRAALVLLTRFEVVWSTTCPAGVDALGLGDPEIPWDSLDQQHTHWAETGLIVTAMNTLARRLPTAVTAAMCAGWSIPGRRCQLISAVPFVEGGCGGCRVTVEVTL